MHFEITAQEHAYKGLCKLLWLDCKLCIENVYDIDQWYLWYKKFKVFPGSPMFASKARAYSSGATCNAHRPYWQTLDHSRKTFQGQTL